MSISRNQRENDGTRCDPFKFVMKIVRLAADLRRLGDKSVTELRKCAIIVSGLSADFEVECRMLENNPAGLSMAEVERVVGNQFNRLLEGFNDWGGRGYGDFVPGYVTKTAPSGDMTK